MNQSTFLIVLAFSSTSLARGARAINRGTATLNKLFHMSVNMVA
jgi:hypothetical protein